VVIAEPERWLDNRTLAAIHEPRGFSTMGMTEHAARYAVSLAAFMWAVDTAQAQHAPEPAEETSQVSPRELESEQWRSDVRFLADAIRERHPHPFHAMKREAFAAAVEGLEARIPELDYPEILVELGRSHGRGDSSKPSHSGLVARRAS
jgi:hypothetical protein